MRGTVALRQRSIINGPFGKNLNQSKSTSSFFDIFSYSKHQGNLKEIMAVKPPAIIEDIRNSMTKNGLFVWLGILFLIIEM